MEVLARRARRTYCALQHMHRSAFAIVPPSGITARLLLLLLLLLQLLLATPSLRCMPLCRTMPGISTWGHTTPRRLWLSDRWYIMGIPVKRGVVVVGVRGTGGRAGSCCADRGLVLLMVLLLLLLLVLVLVLWLLLLELGGRLGTTLGRLIAPRNLNAKAGGTGLCGLVVLYRGARRGRRWFLLLATRCRVRPAPLLLHSLHHRRHDSTPTLCLLSIAAVSSAGRPPSDMQVSETNACWKSATPWMLRWDPHRQYLRRLFHSNHFLSNAC
jgi:hypothetical protein